MNADRQSPRLCTYTRAGAEPPTPAFSVRSQA